MENTMIVPRVSVVVPFLNPGEFLRDAIESVRTQTLDSWELILVDDGSTDSSVQLARQYASTHSETIRYLQHIDQKNHGMPASRNLGILNARGEFIANLDADDVFVRDKLERQVSIMDRFPDVAMTFGPMLVWRSWQGGANHVQQFTCVVDSAIHPPAFIPDLLSGTNDPAGCLIRRTAIERVGGYEDNVNMCEDWMLYVKIALLYQIFVERESNYYYRQHADQSCRVLRRTGHFHSDYLLFFEWLARYLQSVNCNDVHVWRAFEVAVRRNRFMRFGEALKRNMRSVLERVAAASRLRSNRNVD